MRREVRQFIVLTFSVIALVVILTEFRGFASVIDALSRGYRNVVGSFIRPVS